MAFSIEKCIRPNIVSLQPYRCARDDYQSGILLDANENAYGPSLDSSVSDDFAELHRYPDPHQLELKKRIAAFRGLPAPENIFLGVGSDEVIDLLIRITCTPGNDKILITPPTYGMYSVAAKINDVEVVRANLNIADTAPTAEEGRFDVLVESIDEALKANPTVKLVFLCSPGNPTGKAISPETVAQVLELPSLKANNALLIVDEAYIDFAPDGTSAVEILTKLQPPNLVVSQTLSKSFGLAAIRLGMAYSHPAVIHYMNCAKAPYNISLPTATLALKALQPSSIKRMQDVVKTLQQNRKDLIQSLSDLRKNVPAIGRIIGGSDANFIMVEILKDGKPDNVLAEKVYTTLAEQNGVVVRFRGKEAGCTGCLRISIGTVEENKVLLEKLQSVLSR